MRYKAINWLLIILLIILVLNIVRSMANLSREDSIIKEVYDKLQKVKDDNLNLQKELAGVQSPQFIEKEARNKLNLGKEGEIVLILPSISLFFTPTPILPDTSPNWQKWVRLFF